MPRAAWRGRIIPSLLDVPYAASGRIELRKISCARYASTAVPAPEPIRRSRMGAAEVGRLLAAAGRTLVYGGGRVGLMGALADAALELAGASLGSSHRRCWTRKSPTMVCRNCGLLAPCTAQSPHGGPLGRVPHPSGGIGTMEEFFEVWTWGQPGTACEALRPAECGRFLRPSAGVPRPARRPAVRSAGASRHVARRRWSNGVLVDMAVRHPEYAPNGSIAARRETTPKYGGNPCRR